MRARAYAYVCVQELERRGALELIHWVDTAPLAPELLPAINWTKAPPRSASTGQILVPGYTWQLLVYYHGILHMWCVPHTRPGQESTLQVQRPACARQRLRAGGMHACMDVWGCRALHADGSSMCVWAAILRCVPVCAPWCRPQAQYVVVADIDEFLMSVVRMNIVQVGGGRGGTAPQGQHSAGKPTRAQHFRCASPVCKLPPTQSMGHCLHAPSESCTMHGLVLLLPQHCTPSYPPLHAAHACVRGTEAAGAWRLC